MIIFSSSCLICCIMVLHKILVCFEIYKLFCFLIFFHGHLQFTEQQVKWRSHSCSSLPFSVAQEHWHIYLLLCTWDVNIHQICYVKCFITFRKINGLKYAREIFKYPAWLYEAISIWWMRCFDFFSYNFFFHTHQIIVFWH